MTSENGQLLTARSLTKEGDESALDSRTRRSAWQ